MPDKFYRRLSKKLYAFKLFRQLNNQLAKVFRRLPFSSELIGSPRGAYQSALDWVNTSALSHDEPKASYVEVWQSQPIKRPEPKSLEQSIHWKFRRVYANETAPSPLYVVSVPKGRVWSDSAVITGDDKLLADLSVEIGKPMGEHSIFQKWKLRSAYQIHGTAAVLTVPGGSNYFHWMFDVLPRLALIQRSGKSLAHIHKFIVHSCHFPFQEQTLTHLDIPKEKIIESEKYPHIKADELIVSSFLRNPQLGGVIDRFACDFLRKSFLDGTTIPATTGAERIYITRSGASYRNVLNESEVISYLSKLGFKVLALETMSFFEQVTAFAQAKLIVAPHGAGLSNIVFCAPGTKLIELFSPNYVHSCFWALSNYIDMKYYYLLGEGERPSEYIDRPIPYPYMDNISIDIKMLAEIVKLAQIE
jgi:capsular polysaccharide biosynthesis protein